MAFHIDTHDMPYIVSYDEARSIYNRTSIVKNDHESMRRLGKRKNKNKWIRQEMRDGVEYYVAGLHDTGLIYFYPTHMEITMGGWNTLSTKAFISKVANVSIRAYERSKYVPKGYIPMDEPHLAYFLNGYGINCNDKYRFKYNGMPMDIERHPEPIKYRVNRKVIAELRNKYQPFYQYVKTMYNLHGDGVPDAETYKGYIFDDVMKEIHAENKWWECYVSLAHRASVYEWTPTGHRKHVRRYYDMLDIVEMGIRRHNPQVLEIVR